MAAPTIVLPSCSRSLQRTAASSPFLYDKIPENPWHSPPPSVSRAEISSSPWTATCNTIPPICRGSPSSWKPASTSWLHDWGSGFKAYRRALVSDVPIYGELQRLIPLLALRRGAKVTEIPITTALRQHGVSKYGIIKKLPVFFDLITVRFLSRYLARPLHFFGFAGLLGTVAGSVLGFWLLWERLVYGVHIMGEHGPLLIFAAVLIVAGVQLLALGLLAEMHVRYYYESRSRIAPNDSITIVRSASPSQAKAIGAS